ncbi:NusA N-terminal domain-containing protein, partial [Bacillus pumilus]|uniref:NusA N-terminal domain-containing protein n=1 Tax=Bacillus pumilus TaxID=1408 RepID=UPI0037044CF1
MLDPLTLLDKENAITKQIIIQPIQPPLISPYNPNFNQPQNLPVHLNPQTPTIRLFPTKDLLHQLYHSPLQISLHHPPN